jgi:hippurate hydrolase
LGAALVLAQLRDRLPCPVKFLFQPAEEGGAGGKRMVDEGALDDPPVAAVFGYHNWPAKDLPFGTVATRPGAFMAATGLFTILVHGRGGHAASPHQTVDPIVAAAHVVTALQTIVSRNHDPVNGGVVSVTQFHAGTAFNVIPPVAELRGTIRALDDTVLATAARRVTEIAEGVAASLGARAEVDMRLNYPVLRNDAGAVEHIASCARAAGFGGRLVLDHPPIMGGEDFAFYASRAPVCFWFLASKPDGVAEIPGCHHPAFDFNDDILPIAMAMHVETARRFRPAGTA